MIIIFGWQKIAEPLEIAFENFCINCQKNTEWVDYEEAEWVSFFGVKTIKFKSTRFIHCAGCCDELDLSREALKKLNQLYDEKDQEAKDWILAGFSTLIEEHQLASKTETQKAFIRSMREANENLDENPNGF